METVAPLLVDVGLLVLVLVLVPVLVLAGEEELLLQAAAARHKATDADTTTAPFLAILII
jgi:hypothetical protein